MGQWRRDRDCEPAQLTEHQATVSARMGQETPLVYRAQKPRHGRPVGGVFAGATALMNLSHAYKQRIYEYTS